MREADLDSLMGRLARGDRSAFDPLYNALQPRALRLARLRIGDAQAGDVAQEAMLNVFARAGEFTPGRPCLPWFYAIVANRIQTARRRASRFVRDDSAAESVAYDREDADAMLLRRELHRALEQAIDALDDDSAEAIRAALGQSLPPSDVRAATFRKRLSRAYGKLRLLLGGHDAS